MHVAAIIPSRFALRRPPRLPYRRLTALAIKAPIAPPIAKIDTAILHIRVSKDSESVYPVRCKYDSIIHDFIDSCALLRQPVFQPNETTPEPVASAVRINSFVNFYRS
jgi:hypothetical protein